MTIALGVCWISSSFGHYKCAVQFPDVPVFNLGGAIVLCNACTAQHPDVISKHHRSLSLKEFRPFSCDLCKCNFGFPAVVNLVLICFFWAGLSSDLMGVEHPSAALNRQMASLWSELDCSCGPCNCTVSDVLPLGGF